MLTGEENYANYLNGDNNGLAELVRMYRDGLIIYLTGITGSIHTAEDCCEDTFFKLIIKKPEYNGKASFKTWLYRIGRNIAYDKMRKRNRILFTTLNDASDSAESISLEDSYMKTEFQKTLHKCLDRLDVKKREIIWLTYFENLSAKDTAIILGMTEKAVHTSLTRIRTELKNMMILEGYNENI